MYAVIDLETTGLNPDRHDRIIEIAIVQVDPGGDITDEWTTLINPHRDLGPQHIHGISAADARRAPSFADAAPAILSRLAGRVTAAHNLAFDAPFLAHQFRQIGMEVPLGVEAGLCTMTLAATYLPGSGRSLASCCAAAGVPLEHAHCALDDTRAAAMLLGHYIRANGAGQVNEAAIRWRAAVERSRDDGWPSLPEPTGFTPVTRTAPGTERPSLLGRLVDALPRVVTPPESDRYLAVLDRALVGGAISETDADALVDLAGHLGLGRDDVRALHAGYLAALTAALGTGPLETGATPLQPGATRLQPGAADGRSDAASELRALAAMLGVPAGAHDLDVPAQRARAGSRSRPVTP